MPLRPSLSILTILGLGLALVACGSDDTGTDDPGADARAVYSGPESAALGATSNQATCSTCHSDDGTQAGFAGSTLKDLAYHESFKGGAATTFLAAANACVTGWMAGEALMDGDME